LDCVECEGRIFGFPFVVALGGSFTGGRRGELSLAECLFVCATRAAMMRLRRSERTLPSPMLTVSSSFGPASSAAVAGFSFFAVGFAIVAGSSCPLSAVACPGSCSPLESPAAAAFTLPSGSLRQEFPRHGFEPDDACYAFLALVNKYMPYSGCVGW